ncbi:MAG: HAMP domain-containing sensor histidine kinase, partial [Planctomycetota bacterium]
LTALIQRILDFTQQQAGTLQYSREIVDLGLLLRTVCEAYTPHLEARGAILVESLPVEIFVRCDANACESAVVNLLENAAKYGIDGDDDREIELDLRSEDGMASIEVRDRGRGIPRSEVEHVFDGFYRASNSGEVRGAGLGLSLVRHFVRAHGGEVIARARDGGGTVFRLTLPLSKPTEEPSESRAGKAHTAASPSATPSDRT